MEARGILHKVPAIDHSQREQYNQQQQPTGTGNDVFDSDGPQTQNASINPPLPPRQIGEQEYVGNAPSHTSGTNKQQQQQQQGMNGGTGDLQGRQDFDKPSDAYSSPGQVTAGGTMASNYAQQHDQQRMEVPPQGAGGGVGMRSFSKPSDATQAQYEGSGYQGAGGAGQGQMSAGAANDAGFDGTVGAGPQHGQGAATAVGAAAGQGANNVDRHDMSTGGREYDQNRIQPSAQGHSNAGAGIDGGRGRGHGHNAMGPAAAVGAAGLNHHHGRAEHLGGSGGHGASNEQAYDAENNLPVDGHATGVNPAAQGGAAPLSTAPGSGSVASGSGTAQVMIGTLQQAAGTLLNNDGMIAKGLERESRGMAKRDPAQAQALQQEADLTRSQGRH